MSAGVKTTLQPETLEGARQMAKRLHTTLDDIVSIAAHAGIDAMMTAMKETGRIELPAQFTMETPGKPTVIVPAKAV